MTIRRVVVVDDEALARRRVIRMLDQRDEIEVVAEFSGGVAAVEGIQALAPDLVFLDIQMPDMDGFEVLRNLGDTLPAVIFVTAFDQYALRAFDACAIDYLLKPYDADRFTQAVDRALAWMDRGATADDERLRRLLREVLRSEQLKSTNAGPAAARLDRFMVKKLGRSQFLTAGDVDWLEAEGNYVRLHVGSVSHLVRGTIAAFAEKLDPRTFVRVHRRYIVNVERVKEIQPWFGGDYIIVLHDGHQLRLSRSFREHFQSRVLGS